jgi:hypothetical protein
MPGMRVRHIVIYELALSSFEMGQIGADGVISFFS